MRNHARIPRAASLAVLAGLLAGPATAAIQALTLPEMMKLAGGVVAGEITAREGFLAEVAGLGRVPMTRLTIAGRDLLTGRAAVVAVAHLGGTVGGVTVRSSTQPPDRETVPGTRVVAFWAREPAFGCAMLVAQLGGLFRLQTGEAGEVAVGRGPGFAVDKNILLAELEAAARALRPAEREEGR